jgi:3-methyladenine DNA glycosylase AlkD
MIILTCMDAVSKIQRELKRQGTRSKAKVAQGYFKTGKGDYGEGDVFIGVTVPDQRKIAKKYYEELSLKDVRELLKSPIHEHRFTALEILVFKFESAAHAKERDKIADFYLLNTRYINNWDLVDTSASYVLGSYLHDKNRAILCTLARSKNVWERRIAIVATQHFIRNKQFTETFIIAEMLMNDVHDLIHKAVGWMLREVGNQDKTALLRFLKQFHTQMPRVMFRYAVERLTPAEKKQFV